MADDIVSQYYLANALRQGQRQSTRSILAQRMMGNALDSSPTTPLGALARALTGVVAGYAMQNAEQGDRLDQKQALSALMDRDQQQQDEAAAWSARMNGQGGQPPAGGAAPAPAPVMREALPGIGGPAQGGTRQNPAQPGGTAPPGQAGVMPAEMAPLFDAASRETGVPVHILSAVARHESDYGRIPSRPRDGQGVMQVLQSTAAAPGYGVQPLPPAALNDPAQNIAFGARYLAARAPRGTDWSNPEHIAAALRAYNGGGDPDYVRKVMQYIPQAAPGGTVDASAPADVQATLDRLRQQATAPGATAAGGGALPPSSAAAAPATSAAPAPANASLTPSQAMTPERLAWLEQGRASRNPEIRRRAQAELDAWQATRQMAGDQRLEAAAARQEERDRQAMAEQARQQARQDERDRLAQEAAARAEVRANQGANPAGNADEPADPAA